MTDTLPSSPIALIVDDDEVFRQRLSRALSDRGWEAHAASDGATAILLARTRAPQLSIVDLRLPGMGGLEIVRELRRLDTNSCIIMLTGYGSIGTALNAAKLGADHFLTKPADADQILAAYRKLTAQGDAADSDILPVEVPTLARVEWEHIQRVLTDCEGNISQTAKLLGLHRRSLQRKLSKYPPTV